MFIRNNQGEKIAVAVDGLENLCHNRLAFVQHGLSGHKGQTMVRQPVKALVDCGFVVVSFDSRFSFGESDGVLEGASLTSFIDDLHTVVDWAKTQEFYVEPFALSGHSLGGGSVLKYAEDYPQKVSLLMPVAAMVGGKYFIRSRMLNDAKNYLYWKQAGKIYRENKNHPEINGWLSFNVVRDMLRYDLVRDAVRVVCPTLVITGDEDPSSTVYNNSKLFESLHTQKQITILKQCGHLYDQLHNSDDLYQTIRKWVEQNV